MRPAPLSWTSMRLPACRFRPAGWRGRRPVARPRRRTGGRCRHWPRLGCPSSRLVAGQAIQGSPGVHPFFGQAQFARQGCIAADPVGRGQGLRLQRRVERSSQLGKACAREPSIAESPFDTQLITFIFTKFLQVLASVRVNQGFVVWGYGYSCPRRTNMSQFRKIVLCGGLAGAALVLSGCVVAAANCLPARTINRVWW